MMYIDIPIEFDPYVTLITTALEENGLGIRTARAYWLTPDEYKMAQEMLGSCIVEDFEGIEFAPDELQEEYMMALEEEVM